MTGGVERPVGDDRMVVGVGVRPFHLVADVHRDPVGHEAVGVRHLHLVNRAAAAAGAETQRADGDECPAYREYSY